MGLGPLFAMTRAREQTGLSPADADIVELNEAFASQALAVLRGAKSEKFAQTFLHNDHPLGEIPLEKLNVNGGANSSRPSRGRHGRQVGFDQPEGVASTQSHSGARNFMRRRWPRSGLVAGKDVN